MAGARAGVEAAASPRLEYLGAKVDKRATLSIVRLYPQLRIEPKSESVKAKGK
jgi:hypothetical protein